MNETSESNASDEGIPDNQVASERTETESAKHKTEDLTSLSSEELDEVEE